MQRRTILKYTALATGAAVTGPLLTTLLSGCQTDTVEKDTNYKPQFFSDMEFDTLRKMIDLILPATDSPAASEVGVHRIIDHMVAEVYEPQDRLAYKDGFTALLTHLNGGTAVGKDQDRLTSELSLQKLQTINESKNAAHADAKRALRGLRQQTVAYYLSTKEVATNFLNYLPVPGEYEACIKLSDVGGKAWAI